MHQPLRPDWTCAGCGTQWPCTTRQRQLAGQYQNAYVSLVVYLMGFFVEACQDLPESPAGPLHERFLGWAADLAIAAWREGSAIESRLIEATI